MILDLHLLGNLSFLIWIHTQVSQLEIDLLLVLIDLLHDLGVGSVNSFSNLGMKFLDLLGSLFGLPTQFGGHREWSKVQRSPWVIPIDYLEGRASSGLA